MRVLDLAFKDLYQILKDKQSLLFLTILPIVFTLFMGLAFKGVVEPEDPRLVLGWANADPEGLVSQQLYMMLETSDTVRLIDVAPSHAETAAREGDVASVLVIPAEFSQAALSGANPQLKLIADDVSTTGQSLYQILRAPVTQLMSASKIARLDVAVLQAQDLVASADARATERATAFKAAVTAWKQINEQTAWIRVEKAITQKPEAPKDSAPLGGNPYNQTSPGILVQFCIMGLIGSAHIVVMERQIRTLQRLITTAMKRWQIVAGHLLAMFAQGLLQTLLLIVFGQLVLGVNYFREPVATLLVAVALNLWVSCMGLLIGVTARGEEQVILFSLIGMFIFTSLGGAWFPLEGTGKVFSTIGHLTPGAWAMDGFQNILIRGLGLESVWLPVAVLLAYALGFFVLGVWRFKVGEET